MNKYRTIKSIPLSERPRERLLLKGADVLTDQELLAIIIETGSKKSSAIDLAGRVLYEYHDITSLLEVTPEELCQIDGIGTAKAGKIKALLELAVRLSSKEITVKDQINGPEDVYRLLKMKLQGENREHFMVLMLNAKNYLLGVDVVSIGSLTASIVHPREVFRIALTRSSAGVILAHNHPSGDPTPSEEDKKITDRLVEAGEILGVGIIDHVIVGERGYLSFKEQQLV